MKELADERYQIFFEVIELADKNSSTPCRSRRTVSLGLAFELPMQPIYQGWDREVGNDLML